MSMTPQRRPPDPTDDILVLKLNLTKKLACGLGEPSDGLHDPPLERINWNATMTDSELQWATMSYNRPIYGLGKELLGQLPRII